MNLQKRQFLEKVFKVGGLSALVSLGMSCKVASVFAVGIQEMQRSVIARMNVEVGGGGTPSFRSYDVGGTTGFDPSVPMPTGTIEGDLMVMTLSDDDVYTPDAQSGWTLIRTTTVESAATLTSWYKVAGVSESGPYVIVTGSEDARSMSAMIITFSKTGGTWAIHDHQANTADSTTVTSTATDTVDDSILIFMGLHDAFGNITSDPADMTITEEFNISSCAVVGYHESYTTGSSGVTKSITWNDSEQLGVHTICIKLT